MPDVRSLVCRTHGANCNGNPRIAHEFRWETLAHTGNRRIRPALVAGGVAIVSALCLVAMGTDGADEMRMEPVPFVSSVSPLKTYKPTPQPRPSTNTSRGGVRPTLTPRPTESVARQNPSPSPTLKQRVVKAPADIRISFYRDCTGRAQQCIDAGTLTMYGGKILAGHNYMGYQWLSRVPVGRTVYVISGPLAGTYRVYGHMRIIRQGGAIPSFGRADLVFQTCEGSGTGFSLLSRAK